MTFQYFFYNTYFGYFLQVLPIAVIATVICAVIRSFIFKKRHLTLSWPRELVMAIFVCYLTGVCTLVLLPNNLLGHIWYWFMYHMPSGNGFSNLPLFDVSRWAYSFSIGDLLHPNREALGNMLLFIPLGFFVPMLWPLKWWKVIIISFGATFLVEFIQMPIGRAFDARDLVMNTGGAVIGLLIFLLFRLALPNAVKAVLKTKD